MKVIEKITPIRAIIQDIKKQNQRIALVPTLGNLHAGHLSLVKKAKEVADIVIVSIFVNPLQFGVNEDFSTYPRSLEADLEKLAPLGVDLVFTPQQFELFPVIAHINTQVHTPGLSAELCGVTRPHFFAGVTTVLTKLFNILDPDIAIFGEKDYQQLIIVQRMVSDLNFSIKIIGMPIIREADGLAMSSRNQYLTADERAKAPQLYSALLALGDKISGYATFQAAIDETVFSLNKSGFKVDYLELRDAQALAVLSDRDFEKNNRNLRLVLAAYLGNTRLLDTIQLKGPSL